MGVGGGVSVANGLGVGQRKGGKRTVAKVGSGSLRTEIPLPQGVGAIRG